MLSFSDLIDPEGIEAVESKATDCPLPAVRALEFLTDALTFPVAISWWKY